MSDAATRRLAAAALRVQVYDCKKDIPAGCTHSTASPNERVQILRTAGERRVLGIRAARGHRIRLPTSNDRAGLPICPGRRDAPRVPIPPAAQDPRPQPASGKTQSFPLALGVPVEPAFCPVGGWNCALTTPRAADKALPESAQSEYKTQESQPRMRGALIALAPFALAAATDFSPSRNYQPGVTGAQCFGVLKVSGVRSQVSGLRSQVSGFRS